MIRTGTFFYVPWDQVAGYHQMGWMIVSDLGPTHGQYAVLMWRCDCRPFFKLLQFDRSRTAV